MEYWSLKQVCEELNVGRSTLHELRKDPSFPEHFLIQKQVRYVADDIRAWKAAKVAKIREANRARLGLINGGGK